MAIETSDEILLQGISQCDLSKGMWYLDTGASGHKRGGRELIYDLTILTKVQYDSEMGRRSPSKERVRSF